MVMKSVVVLNGKERGNIHTVFTEVVVTIVAKILTLLDGCSIANRVTNAIDKIIYLDTEGENCLHIEVEHVGNFLELPRSDGSGRGNRAKFFTQPVMVALHTDGKVVELGKGDCHLWLTIMYRVGDFNFFNNKKGDPPGIFFCSYRYFFRQPFLS